MNESNSLKSLAMVTNRQSWQLFWRQKNILSDVIAAYYGHCTKLGDIASMLQYSGFWLVSIGQYCLIQLCHWLKLYSSQLYSSDYLFICHVFEQSAWHYPYVLDLYVSMPFSVVIQFTRQWPDLRHWDKSRMKRRGVQNEASWYLGSLVLLSRS